MAVDPKKLTDQAQVRTLLANAERRGEEKLAIACIERLAELGAKAQRSSDPVELECWKAIIAAEEFATRNNRRTTRLTRTRQKIGRVGVIATISDLAGSSAVQQGFELLRDCGRLDLSFEAISLKHPDIFSAAVRANAAAKLRAAGYNQIDGR